MIDDDTDFGPPGISVFEMFLRNGSEPGFWVRRSQWANTVCRVVAGRGSSGGCAGRAPPIVTVEWYDAETGRLRTPAAPLKGACSVAYDYRRVDPPWWWVEGDEPGRAAGQAGCA